MMRKQITCMGFHAHLIMYFVNGMNQNMDLTIHHITIKTLSTLLNQMSFHQAQGTTISRLSAGTGNIKALLELMDL